MMLGCHIRPITHLETGKWVKTHPKQWGKMCWALLCTIQVPFQVQVGPKMGVFGVKKQPKWQDAILSKKINLETAKWVKTHPKQWGKMCWALLCTIQVPFQVQVGPKMGVFGVKKQPKQTIWGTKKWEFIHSMTTPFKVLGPLFLSKIDISNTLMVICSSLWHY